MKFAHALKALEAHEKIRRRAWVNVSWIVMMPALYLPPASTTDPGPKVNDRTARHIGTDRPLDSEPYIAAMTSTGKWQPGWTPRAADLFADDWEVLDGNPV